MNISAASIGLPVTVRSDGLDMPGWVIGVMTPESKIGVRDEAGATDYFPATFVRPRASAGRRGGATVNYATATGDRFFQVYGDIADARDAARALLTVPDVCAVSVDPDDAAEPIERYAHRGDAVPDGKRVAAITEARRLIRERDGLTAKFQAYETGQLGIVDPPTDADHDRRDRIDMELGWLVEHLI